MPEYLSSTDSAAARLLLITIPLPSNGPHDDWRGRGLCVGADPEAFFPSHGDPGAEARQVCSACAVRSACLDYATAADEFGIWGGLDQQERRNLKRRQQRRHTANRTRASSGGSAA
jgi:hypothetical protein